MAETKRRRVRISDVAALAQVDRAVVSKVINGSSTLNIRPETRERVWSAIRTLNYRPNEVARSLRTAKTGILGLVIPDFNNPIYASIITGAQLAAAERGQLVFAASADDGSSVASYVEVVSGGRVDGVLLAGGQATDELRARIDSFGLPVIFLNRKSGSSRYIVLDDAGATQLAVDHLVGLGHRAIAHVAGPQTADTAVRRTGGFRQAMATAGLPVRRGYVVEADYTYVGGLTAMNRLLALASRPTAVVVSNIASAIGAVRAARVAGVRIPREVSIVAVHDLPLVEYLDPPLTTVHMPVQELGHRGIEVLSTVPADARVEEVLASPMRLVVRDSTAPPSR